MEKPIESKHEQQSKQQHLNRVTELLSSQSFDRLSTWMSLTNTRNQTQAQAQTQPDFQSRSTNHLRPDAGSDSNTWCPTCFASCSIKSNLKLNQLILACQRPCCAQKFSKPIFSHSTYKQEDSRGQVKADPTMTKPEQPETKRQSSATSTTTNIEENINKDIKQLEIDTNNNNNNNNKSRKRNKNKSALSELLAKRKKVQEASTSSVAQSNLHSFLTQL